jgi:hypothetical protein
MLQSDFFYARESYQRVSHSGSELAWNLLCNKKISVITFLAFDERTGFPFSLSNKRYITVELV